MTNDSALFAFQQLDIYRVARELAIAVREADIRHPELRDQASRASISAFLTLSEGLPNDGPGMRRKYFTESNNSLHETVAAVDLAAAIGAPTSWFITTAGHSSAVMNRSQLYAFAPARIPSKSCGKFCA